ncbi:MAG TPA: NrfD/PsrC family molybdoenzyme membrane anchor subunit [Candidatus Sulfotelmatobacter sp.]|nr:NrfD/PsrC family molybdoenzyme membrane anchor subunit [Candidatus Sulfotelmatobacter sp.]
MSPEATNIIFEVIPRFEGYAYPNEATPHPLWTVLIVLYPYITGLVAGAFIMASLVRVFKVKALEPVYRLSLLTAFAFLLCAPLPLLLHLGHPERCFEVMMTPHLTSPMAIFGFVYAWYLMAVLLLELWFDYRADFVAWAKVTPGFRGLLYRALTLGVSDLSPAALKLDAKIGHILSIVGIPSAFILHGYVGFIFGSVKANPWWGNVLMPIIFIMSAMVSGIALCVFNYMFLTWARRRVVDMKCLDTMTMFLFYALVLDAAIEGLDWIHRVYSAEEGFKIMQYMAQEKLFWTLNLGQALFGTAVPLLFLGLLQLIRGKVPELWRRRMYFGCALFILAGVLAMRWNVVIGGQMFSKSLRGLMSYKMEFAGLEGWLMSGILFCLPFAILFTFIKLFLSEKLPVVGHLATPGNGQPLVALVERPDDAEPGEGVKGLVSLIRPFKDK